MHIHMFIYIMYVYTPCIHISYNMIYYNNAM